MKINREESLKRIMEAVPGEEELKNTEVSDAKDWDDSDLIMMYGVMLKAREMGAEVEAEDVEAEIERRSAIYMGRMLMEEGLLALEDDDGEED